MRIRGTLRRYALETGNHGTAFKYMRYGTETHAAGLVLEVAKALRRAAPFQPLAAPEQFFTSFAAQSAPRRSPCPVSAKEETRTNAGKRT